MKNNIIRKYTGNRSVITLAVALGVVLLLSPVVAESEPEPESGIGARQFAAEALAFRAAGLIGQAQAVEVLSAMPGAGDADARLLATLWSPFFANAIVKLGRINAMQPAALYYNPLLDIALYTFWRADADGYRIVSARTQPGSTAEDPAALPAWLSAQVPEDPAAQAPQGSPTQGAENSAAEGPEISPVEALLATTKIHLDAFRRQHPAAALEAGRDPLSDDEAEQQLPPVLRRLLWNIAQITRWNEQDMPWLPPVLADIQQALTAHDPTGLVVAAPGTDDETAAVLAELPPEFAAGLTLDMVLELPDDRLLIGSLPDDGAIYILAQCRPEASGCGLRRLVLLSLLDQQ